MVGVSVLAGVGEGVDVEVDVIVGVIDGVKSFGWSKRSPDLVNMPTELKHIKLILQTN